MRRTFVLVVTALAMPAAAIAQDRDRDFTFRERVPAGAWLRVHTVHGDVRVTEGSGANAEVIGRKDGDDAADLRIARKNAGRIGLPEVKLGVPTIVGAMVVPASAGIRCRNMCDEVGKP